MKKLLSTVALAAMLFATSCSDEEQVGPAQGGEVDAAFEVGLPGVDTRAISDGNTAKTLSWAVYEAGQTTPLSVSGEDGATFNASRSATLNIKLLEGKSYDIIFWADAADSPYTFDMAAQTISFKEGAAVLANDENRDAFYAVLKGYTPDGSRKQVTLSRPFAQVNFGTDDLGVIADQFVPTESKVVIENAYTGMNLMTGTPTGEAVAVTYEFNALPEATEEFPIAPDTYKYLATAYVIVPAEKSVVNAAKFTAKSETGEEVVGTNVIKNVPVQRNYRTNIYGSLLTKAQGYKVTISYGYEGNLVYDDASFQTAFSQGGDVVLANDISATDLSFNTAKPTTVDLNGHTLTLDFQHSETVQNGADITFKNGKIVNTQLNSLTNCLILVESNSSVTLEDVAFTVEHACALYPRGDAARVTVKNSTIVARNYAVATNAAQMENYGVVIDLINSTLISNNSTVLVNIPCSLKITNCTVAGAMHGVVVRGGTAEIADSDISLDYDGSNPAGMNAYFDNQNWGSGNTVNIAAMTIGNKSTSYQYATNVTLTNTKVYTTGDNASYFPAMYVYANQGEGVGVTLNYDGQTTFTGGTPGNIVYGIKTNVLVNGAQPE